jgi:hypothetical protein
MTSHARSHLFIRLSFIAATIVVTWPLVLRMNQGVPYGGDASQFIWNGWWFAKAASDPDLSLWWTPYQYAPHGASLVLHDLSPLNAAIQALLRGSIGDFAAYNVLILFHYILAAWGAYILSYYLTGNRPASVVAGVIYGFSAHHAMHLSQLSTVSNGWIPLAVYYLLKYTRDSGPRDGVMSVLMILAAALSHWYSLVFTAVVFFGFMLIGQVGLRDDLGGTRRWLRALSVWILSGLILSPLLVAAWLAKSTVKVEWLVEMGRLYVLDPIRLILPPPANPFFGGLVEPLANTLPGNATEGVASIGIVAALLGLASWFRKNPTTRAWCWLALILFLLAIGPKLIILGKVLPVPGPFLIWEKIPGLDLVRVPARFVGPFTLALAMSVATMLSAYSGWYKSGWRRFLVLWLLPIVIITETLVIPIPMKGKELYHPSLTRLPEIYSEATGDPSPPDLIVEFPLMPLRAQFMYQQTIHGIPTVNGSLSNPPPGAIDYFIDFNWSPEYMRSIGVDMIIYQPWAVLDQGFTIPMDEEGSAAQWAGRKVDPIVFFRDVMGLKIGYEDERMTIFVL